jgi:hypothetical protein
MREEYDGWESSEVEEDVTAIGLQSGGADSASDESGTDESEFEDDEVLVSEAEEQEEVEALGHCVLFYPKFHCELNFIERYWCRAKWFTRENCEYNFEALKSTVPEALASVTNASIRGFYRLAVRTIDAYSAGLRYGTEEFKHTVYKSHRQVEDKTKW